MEDKKHPGRFTILFDLADAQQRAASEELARHGRRKARFLADAILYYTRSQSPQSGAAVDEATLMRCVAAAMERVQRGEPGPGDVPATESEPAAPAAVSESSPWSSEDISVIAGTLSAFQK